MKKRLLLTITAICLCLCACGQRAVPLTETVWKLSAVQDANGVPIAVSSALHDVYPDADVRELYCTLSSSSFTIEDGESDEAWSGSYASGGGVNIYTISINGKHGTMSSGIATETGGKQTKKLYLTVGGYTLGFEA